MKSTRRELIRLGLGLSALPASAAFASVQQGGRRPSGEQRPRPKQAAGPFGPFGPAFEPIPLSEDPLEPLPPGVGAISLLALPPGTVYTSFRFEDPYRTWTGGKFSAAAVLITRFARDGSPIYNTNVRFGYAVRHRGHGVYHVFIVGQGVPAGSMIDFAFEYVAPGQAGLGQYRFGVSWDNPVRGTLR